MKWNDLSEDIFLDLILDGFITEEDVPYEIRKNIKEKMKKALEVSEIISNAKKRGK